MKLNQKCLCCGNLIKGFPHSGSPLVEGLVCSFCNETRVIPHRISLLENLDNEDDVYGEDEEFQYD
jgi:hypothetical protein